MYELEPFELLQEACLGSREELKCSCYCYYQPTAGRAKFSTEMIKVKFSSHFSLRVLNRAARCLAGLRSRQRELQTLLGACRRGALPVKSCPLASSYLNAWGYPYWPCPGEGPTSRWRQTSGPLVLLHSRVEIKACIDL